MKQKQLYDKKTGEAISPITHMSSVTNDKGESLQAILEEHERAVQEKFDGSLVHEIVEDDTKAPSSKAVFKSLNEKVNKEEGKGLSSNDYTAEEKTKLAGVEEGAQKNVLPSQELGDSETDVVSQKIATDIYRKFLSNKSMTGIPNVDYGHIYNIPAEGGGKNGEYIKSADFDTAWVFINKEGKISVTGANVTRLIFFKGDTPIKENFVDTQAGTFVNRLIPGGTNLMIITLKKSDNTAGYDNLRVTHDGISETIGEFNEKTLYMKEKLFANSSITGIVTIDKNHLYSLDGEKSEYEENNEFDTAWVSISDDSKYLEVVGVKIVRVMFFKSNDINQENYISNTTKLISNVPDGAKIALINLRKSDNADYDNFKVNQNGNAASLLKLYQGTGSIFTCKHEYVSRNGYIAHTSENISTTPYLPISGKEDIIVKGANNATIPVITFYDNDYNFLSAYEDKTTAENRTYKILLSEIPYKTKYIRCSINEDADLTDGYVRGFNLASILSMIDDVMPKYKKVVTGKNLINTEDLLKGYTYSADSGLIAKKDGILSNKMRLTPGNYTLQGVKPFASNVVRILRFDDTNNLIGGDSITLDSSGIGHYVVTASVSRTSNGSNAYTSYWRLVLQYDTKHIFENNVAQFEKNKVATDVEKCKTELVKNPSYDRTQRMAFITGASTSMPGNGYFETACAMLGFKHRNVAISGESVMQHATKAWRGELYTQEELEDIDIFVTSHIHNYNVAFDGKSFEKVETIDGYIDLDGNIKRTNASFDVDVYRVPIFDTYPKKVNVWTMAYKGTTPNVAFYRQDRTFISGINFRDVTSESATPITKREIEIPEGTAYVYVKKFRMNGAAKTMLKGQTKYLFDTIEEYEQHGYSGSENTPLNGALDKMNPEHHIVPYGGGGAAGPQTPSDEYDERYAAGYDYLLKKYAYDCYHLKDNPKSKWYGTKSGKPCIIICINQWHDGYVRFNKAIEIVARRHGAIFCNTADNMNFSYLQTNPFDTSSIRWNAIHCNNSAYGSGNDTENEPINGIMYTNMGWHCTRDWSSPVQMKRAQILAESMKIATYNDAKFGQMI